MWRMLRERCVKFGRSCRLSGKRANQFTPTAQSIWYCSTVLDKGTVADVMLMQFQVRRCAEVCDDYSIGRFFNWTIIGCIFAGTAQPLIFSDVHYLDSRRTITL